jgi:dihydrofolate synthase/folylpolyglutamate synthase
VIAHAAALGADLRLIGRDFDFVREGEAWTYRSAGANWPALPPVPFASDVQYSNAAACAAVVESLAVSLPVPPGDVAAGIAAARLHGRSEQIVRDGVEWIFDVAHNPAAARVLRRALEGLPAARRTLAVFGVMHDKDVAGVLEQLAPFISAWHVAQVDVERGATVASLVERIAAVSGCRASAHADAAAACLAAAAEASPGDRVLVFGSFHTVGPAMAALGLYSTPSPRE